MKHLHERRPTLGPIVTNDIDLARPADYHLDVMRADAWRVIEQDRGRPDWVVTNPTFTGAFDILQQAVAIARIGVVLMVRVSFSDRPSWAGRG
jgi:hypothetical protein